MDLLMLDKRKPLTDLNATEPPYRLYACQSHVMYSRPLSVDGVPPLVSRRALETLTYLARNHPLVARLLLEFRLPQVVLKKSMADGNRGKSVIFHDESMSDKLVYREGQTSLALLLSLLNQPMYLRSIAHLEQLLNLLDVVIDNAEKKSNSSDDPVAFASEQSDPRVLTSGADMIESSASASGEGLMMVVTSCDIDRQSAQSVLNNSPKPELQLLCSLLAREGYAEI